MSVIQPTVNAAKYTPATKTVCDWIGSLTLDHVPQDVQQRVKHLMLDGIACAIIGAQLPWSEVAARGVLTMESPGPCGLYGRDEKLGPLPAALLNSTYIQAFELDDYHSEAPIHLASVVLPVLIAASQYNEDAGPVRGSEIKGSSFLLATIVGYELGPRIGLGLWGGDILSRGWHSGVVFGPAAAASAVGKLLNLSSNAVEDALGIACTQACGLMAAQYGSMVKRMQHGFAARNGLFAALMAKEGFTGIKEVLECPYGGFLSTFGSGSKRDPPYLPERIIQGLGSEWEIDRINVKPYASMAACHGTIDCVRAISTSDQTCFSDLDSIKSIVVEMSEPAFKKGGWDPKRPLLPTGAQMSAAFAAAAQIVDGQVLPAQFSPEAIDRDILWAWISKIRCIHNHEFDVDKTTMWFQHMTISYSDGRPDTQQLVRAPRGVDPLLTNEEIVSKWLSLTEGRIESGRRDAIQNMVLGLENLRNIDELVELLLGK